MRAIVRKLFGERTQKYKNEKANGIFSRDISIKILQLIAKYNVSNESPFHLYESKIATVPIFLERLSYHVPSGIIGNSWDLNQIVDFLSNCDLSKYLDILELHINTLFEVCSRLNGTKYCFVYLEEFNNLMGLYEIPFKLVFNEELSRAHIEKIESEVEEENKQLIYSITKHYPKVNEYFTNAISEQAKNNYPESIDNAYLTLEQYLKNKTGNQKLDANKNYSEFRKKFSKNYKGIFKVRDKIIESKINTIYDIRSEIKAHSPKGTFDTTEFLEETARFQLNEVMTCIILLEQLSGN